jgi:glycosyltransferase involved in cell wall biosynthesis
MSTTTPLVSVIIPTRNRAALLREAIESALAVRQDGFALEIIVIDDGSTDDTRAVTEGYPVTYLQGEQRGASAARNTGMVAARGDFITFLDDDDVWLPTNLAPQVRAFAQHPEYGAVFARVQLTDANRVAYGDPIPAEPKASGWIFEDLLTYWPQLGCVVVRTAVAREVGSFDTTLISEEDWDFLLRIARRYPIGRIEDVAVLFRQRGDGDEQLAWERFPHSLRAFHRHTHDLPTAKRLRLQRVIWAHRGALAAEFFHYAQYHSRRGNRSRALRCVGYAMRASPVHTLSVAVREWRREPASRQA